MNHRAFIKTNRLRYSYRKQNLQWVLDRIDLTIPPEEFLLICGPSGSGKSTLCRTFNGLIPHFYNGILSGEVAVAGQSTLNQTVGTLFRQVGMVFQNPETQLFNHTVRQEIAYGLESLGLPRKEVLRRVEETADRLHISNLMSRNPHHLSGGEQQLVCIAAILAIYPQLLVMDEPYANLDPVNVRRVRETLQGIHGQRIGVVICEHRLAYTVPDVQRMVVLAQGKILLDGPPCEVMKQDLEAYGLETPLAVRVGQELALNPLPLKIESLAAAVSRTGYPSFLKPLFPEPISNDVPSVLAVEHLSFRLNGVDILRDVSFNLRKGECLAVVGANGAGKTALLKHLIGLYRPSHGRVVILGGDARNSRVSQLARRVGVAFQNPNDQFFKLNVWDEIIVSAKALDCYDESWIKESVALFELEPLLNRAPFRLSGGEKKRVAFAAALAAKPMILALDEPTAGQGFYFRRALGRLLAKLKALGQSVILVTHDLAFAEQHAHRWLLLSEGRVVAEGKPWEVMANPEGMERAHLEPTDAFRLWGTNKEDDAHSGRSN